MWRKGYRFLLKGKRRGIRYSGWPDSKNQQFNYVGNNSKFGQSKKRNQWNKANETITNIIYLSNLRIDF